MICTIDDIVCRMKFKIVDEIKYEIWELLGRHWPVSSSHCYSNLVNHTMQSQL
jgi:hypothetical protein